MAQNTYNEIRALLAVTLADAEEMARDGTMDPSSEDVRALGITLFLESRRAQVVLPDRVRFVAKCYELLPTVGEETYRMVLDEFGMTGPTSTVDLEVMKSFISSLVEETIGTISAASPSADSAPGESA